MNNFWKRVVNFMADYNLDFDQLSKLTDVSVEDIKSLTKSNLAPSNIIIKKINYYVDYFMNKEEWQLEAETKLYLIQTKLTARRIEDYLNIFQVDVDEFIELINMPKKAYEKIYENVEDEDF